MRPKTIEEFAKALNLSKEALDRRRRMIRMDHPDDVEARLLKWLQRVWEDNRDHIRLLAKGGGYTESYPRSMGASSKHLRGNLHHEPEAVDPTEIDDYRESKQAAARFESERQEQVQDLMGAVQAVKGAVAGLDPDMKKKISRELFTLRGRIDALERKVKRQLAA